MIYGRARRGLINGRALAGGDRRVHLEPTRRATVPGGELTAEAGDTATHAGDAEALRVVVAGHVLVGDPDGDRVREVADLDRGLGMRRVLDDVGQRLLEHPVYGNVDVCRERPPLPVHRHIHRDAGLLDACTETLEQMEARCGRLTDRLAGVVRSDRGQCRTKVRQGLRGGAADGVERDLRLFGPGRLEMA